jgi:DNA primase
MYRSNKRAQADIYTGEQVQRVLNGCGIDTKSEMEGDFMIFCPYHNNFRTASAEVNKTTGLFFCFSCQETATLIDLVMHVSNRTYFESVRYIKSKEQEQNIEQLVSKKLIEKKDFIEFDSELINKLNEQALNSERAVKYFEKRLITKDSIVKFKLGYSEKQDMVVVPVHTATGICIGIVGRSVEGKEFKNSPGLPKSKTLFNINRVKTANRVYVVESSFDVIRLDQVGLPAVATLGANVSTQQIELLQKYFNDIMVIADNDEAGGNMKNKIIEKLKSRVSVIQLNKEYKDIGDMDDQAIKNLEFQFDKSISSMLN